MTLTATEIAPEIAAAVSDVSRIRTRAIDRVAYANDASHYLLTPEGEA